MRWTGNKTLPRGVHRRQLDFEYRRRRDDPRRRRSASAAGAHRGRHRRSCRFWRDGGSSSAATCWSTTCPAPTHFDAIRSRNFIYAEHPNGDRELYDLRRIRTSSQSEHANPAYDAMKASLAARLHKLVSCGGATCRARPAVTFSATRRGRCGTVVAAIGGPTVSAVTLSVNGRRAAIDTRAPFRANLHFRTHATVRARIATRFDQVVTADRTVRACR